MIPPRGARALLTRSVPDDEAGRSVIGDLDEEFAQRAARSRGPGRARLWYWRQAVAMWCWSAMRHPHTSYHLPVGGSMFDTVLDCRHAIRVARKSPGQSALIILTLALAIGTTTIGFSFADTVFLRGLPIANPTATVIVYGIDARNPERRTGVFFSDYIDFRERARTVEKLSTWTQTRVTAQRTGSDPVRLTVSRTTGDLFGVWEFRTQLGRGLRASDDNPSAARVAVLSDRYWTDAYARADDVLGQTIMLDGHAHEIVGVLTPDVEFGTFANIAMWVSYPFQPTDHRDLRPTMITGRLADGATTSEAAAEFQALAANLEQEHPETNRGRQTLVLQANRAMGGPNLALVMLLLVGTAGLVTVVASVNVAGVLLSRAVARQREFALRVALGARRLRVFRQLAVEGLLLATFGALGGLAVAEGGLRLIRSVDAEPIFQQIVIDWHEVVFVMALAMVAPLLFSLAPALAALRVNLVGALNAAGLRTIGSGRRLRNVLVTSQLALAVALAIIGGLVARTAAVQLSATKGFNTSGLLTFSLALDPQLPLATRRQQLQSFNERLRAHGAHAVGLLDTLPAAVIEASTPIELPGRIGPGDNAGPWAHRIAVDDGAFDALGIPIVSGRTFTAADIDSDRLVAIVSRETARRYFKNDDDAVGRALAIREGNALRTVQVIGVTGDVRNTDPERGMPPRVWMPMANPTTVRVVVKTNDYAMTTAAIRALAREVVPGVPVESLEAYDAAIARMQGGDRVAMGMLVSFASVAVLFAAIGLYGTVALSTSLRGPEFATRYALGAQVGSVTSLVFREAFKLVAIGMVPGVALGLLAAAGMRRLLFGVSPLDPLNLLAVILLLTVMALAASLAPAIRAARLDLVKVLRA
jgi:predicted permease